MSGLGSTVMTGMAFGAGSEIAHQAVRGMMGSGSGHHDQQMAQQQQMAPAAYGGAEMNQAQAQQNPCMGFNQTFLSCLKQYTNDIGLCQGYMD